MKMLYIAWVQNPTLPLRLGDLEYMIKLLFASVILNNKMSIVIL